MQNTFSNNLKIKRKEKGLTQEEIAENLKIKRSRYASWEEGRGTPPRPYLVQICEILEIDDLYLFLSKQCAEC